jgi:peptide/nickel transport system substrate-binding protein
MSSVTSSFTSMSNFLRRVILTAGLTVLLGQSAMAVTMRVGINDDPDQIDPALSRSYSARLVLTTMCGKLFDITPDLKIIPQLATGFEWSDNDKVLTIKLRPGLKFDDGEPLDAEAVKYNFERNINLPGSLRKIELLAVTSVEAVDPVTVKVNLKEPQAPLPSMLTDRAGMMISPKAAKTLGENFGSAPSCAGPFKFVSRAAQGRIILEKSPSYFDAANVFIDRVEMLAVTDTTIRLANLQSGQFDLIERVSPTDIDQIKKDSRLKLATAPDLGYGSLTFNVNNGPRSATFKDPRLREAVDLAIDRVALAKVAFNDAFIPGSQFIGPLSYYYRKDAGVQKRDVERAKQLLKEAGQPNFSFKLSTRPDRDFQVPAQVIQSMLKDAGINMEIDTQENVTMMSNGVKGNLEASMSFWSGRIDPDGNIASFVHSQGSLNTHKYTNPEMDRLVDQGRQMNDPAARKAIYDKVGELFNKERPLLVLWHRQIFIAHTTKVTGFNTYPDGLVRLVGVKMQ